MEGRALSANILSVFRLMGASHPGGALISNAEVLGLSLAIGEFGLCKIRLVI